MQKKKLGPKNLPVIDKGLQPALSLSVTVVVSRVSSGSGRPGRGRGFGCCQWHVLISLAVAALKGLPQADTGSLMRVPGRCAHGEYSERYPASTLVVTQTGLLGQAEMADGVDRDL